MATVNWKRGFRRLVAAYVGVVTAGMLIWCVNGLSIAQKEPDAQVLAGFADANCLVAAQAPPDELASIREAMKDAYRGHPCFAMIDARYFKNVSSADQYRAKIAAEVDSARKNALTEPAAFWMLLTLPVIAAAFLLEWIVTGFFGRSGQRD